MRGHLSGIHKRLGAEWHSRGRQRDRPPAHGRVGAVPKVTNQTRTLKPTEQRGKEGGGSGVSG